MRVAVIHNAITREDSADETDVLLQLDSVSSALYELEHDVIVLSCSLDLSKIKNELENIKPDLVFNLVESLNGDDSFIHLFPTLLDTLRIPYTGSNATAIYLTSHKILSKERMQLLNLPTPAWIGPYPQQFPFIQTASSLCNDPQYYTWLIKSVSQHASIGIDQHSLISNSSYAKLMDQLKIKSRDLCGSCFAELYIEGREFNLSILSNRNDPQVLPPAEIVFDHFSEHMPKIVGYRAKWDTDSYEYQHTPRTFSFSKNDAALLDTLSQLALRAFNGFGLSGYARVDFRVDADGTPYILEINANPCLSKDAGFAAAIEQANLTYVQAIQMILHNTTEHHISTKHPAIS
ncbi:MAG: D-alanine--D-alanine ligase [Desulfobacterales bacterium]|nr:D-alanine--D-alanine ligase [Desulfobacterales bacterium]